MSDGRRTTVRRGYPPAALLVLVPAVFVLLLHQRHFDYTADDAFITYRFARNWAAGHGPVFNPGEAPVEGYTTFTWMAWMSLHFRSGLDNPQFWGALWGLLCAGGCLFLVARRPPDGEPGLAGSWFLAAAGPFAFWAGAGMETPLFALLLLLFVLPAADMREVTWRTYALGGLGTALVMTRPDGAPVVAAVGAYLLVRRRRRVALVVSATAAIGYLPYFMWRWSYYDSMLPNTLYAKSGDWPALAGAGLLYWRDFLLWCGAPLAPLLWLMKVRPVSNRSRLIIMVLVIQGLYVLLVGGDFMPYFRFMAPLLPLVAILLDETVSAVPWAASKRLPFTLLVAAAALWPSFTGAEYRQYRLEQDILFPRWEAVGRRLGEVFPAGTRVACTAIGRIPYFSGLPTLDMLGLTDRHIAHVKADFDPSRRWHEKHDGDYVLRRRPDILLVGNGLVTKQPSIDFQATVQEMDLFADMDRFDRLYRPVNIRLPDGRYLAFFAGTWFTSDRH